MGNFVTKTYIVNSRDIYYESNHIVTILAVDPFVEIKLYLFFAYVYFLYFS